MTRLDVDDLKQAFGRALNRVAHGKETIILKRRWEDVAALISLDDLRLLERLRAEEEDRLDVRAVR